MAMTRYYHRTDEADAILRDGFRDGVGTYLTERTFSGVWISDRPLDGNEGAYGAAVLGIDIDADLAHYEWVEEGKGYREWLVPAELLNTHATTVRTDF